MAIRQPALSDTKSESDSPALLDKPAATPAAEASTETAVDGIKPESSELVMAAATEPNVEEVFRQLVEARRQLDPQAWESAESRLQQAGDAALPVLTQALRSEDGLVRELATMVLAGLGPSAESACDQLLPLLKDESVMVRVNAAAALSLHPQFAEQAVPALIELLDEPALQVRITAVVALGNTEQAGAPAVESLVRLLQTGDITLQTAIVTTLGRFGATAAQAVPALKELRERSAGELKTAIESALTQIEQPQTDSPEQPPLAQ